jgi:hypothetical protein
MEKLHKQGKGSTVFESCVCTSVAPARIVHLQTLHALREAELLSEEDESVVCVYSVEMTGDST